MNDKTREQIMSELAAFFARDEVKVKPLTVAKDGTRALACWYVDARAVMDRLDEVLGLGNWSMSYRETSAGGGIICRLKARVGGEWVEHEDVGSFSEQPDEGDRYKAAVSDALKRAAVHLGIGRYLYRMPQTWLAYDSQKRRFATDPVLPSAFTPRPATTSAAGQRPETAAPKQAAPKGAATIPANGAELQQRLNAFEAQLVKQGRCRPGELVNRVVEAGVKAGFAADLATWSGRAITLAVEEAKRFQGSRVRQAA